jgi:hypothetical protein
VAKRVRSCVCANVYRGFQIFKFEISDLRSRAENISRQLRGWADSLQNSEIRGQRYLTDKGRRATKEAREREEFLKELRDMLKGSQLKVGRGEGE